MHLCGPSMDVIETVREHLFNVGVTGSNGSTRNKPAEEQADEIVAAIKGSFELMELLRETRDTMGYVPCANADPFRANAIPSAAVMHATPSSHVLPPVAALASGLFSSEPEGEFIVEQNIVLVHDLTLTELLQLEAISTPQREASKSMVLLIPVTIQSTKTSRTSPGNFIFTVPLRK